METTPTENAERLEAGSTPSARLAGPVLWVNPPAASDWGAPAFVGGIWALMLLAALAYVARYGSNAPNDEWDYVPILTGNRPPTLASLWDWHLEHRIFLPRLIWLMVIPLTHDFRAVPFLNVLALGALAFALIRAAKGLRGRTSYADAFFPLALLNWGQGENLLASLQVQMVASTVLAGTLLLLIVKGGERLGLRALILAGLCLVLLPLCGANGVALVPALALWLGYWAVRHWRSREPHGRRNGFLIGTLAGGAVLIVCLYFRGFSTGDPRLPHPGLGESLVRGTEFLSGGLGGALASQFWPVSGMAVLTLMLASAAVLSRVWYKRPQERCRSLGLFLFLAAMGCLTVGIGWGRANQGPESGWIQRYVTIAAPALCCVYLLWGIYGAAGSGRLIQFCLFTLACAALLPNLQAGRDVGERTREPYEALENDLRAGLPCRQLAQRYVGRLGSGCPSSEEELAEHFRMLRDARVGQFRLMKDGN